MNLFKQKQPEINPADLHEKQKKEAKAEKELAALRKQMATSNENKDLDKTTYRPTKR